jgi:hypothetical protein
MYRTTGDTAYTPRQGGVEPATPPNAGEKYSNRHSNAVRTAAIDAYGGEHHKSLTCRDDRRRMAANPANVPGGLRASALR